VPATAAVQAQSPNHVLVCAAGLLVPGLGHLWLGRRKGIIFLAVLPVMFALGLYLEAALANMGIGAPYIVARAMGYGAGNVIAVTYEYGNTFLIVAGLLNTLVVIDAFDISMGRK
jgi:hypothetical protein